MIAVCGANGTIGSRVVAALRAGGAKIRAFGRTPPSSNEPPMEFAAVDFSKKEGLAPVLGGAEKLFLLCPVGVKQIEMELNIVQAAAESGVKQIVKLSAMGAGSQSPIEFARIHGRVEEAIRTSGCAWTFIRPNMFMQNLFWYKSSLQQGRLSLPLGQAPVSHVDAEDVAAVAAHALLEGKHAGKAYTITGPEALTGAEMAEILSRVLGKRIEYQPVSDSNFRAYLKSAGESDYVADAEAGLFSHWSEGHGSDVTGDLAAVKRAKATTLEEFARREREQLA